MNGRRVAASVWCLMLVVSCNASSATPGSASGDSLTVSADPPSAQTTPVGSTTLLSTGVSCGQRIIAPASSIGIETEKIVVAEAGRSVSVRLRNSSKQPITVEDGNLLVHVSPEGVVDTTGGLEFVDPADIVILPGDSALLPLHGDVSFAGASVATVNCTSEVDPANPSILATAEYEFVLPLIDSEGITYASDPISLLVGADGSVSVP